MKLKELYSLRRDFTIIGLTGRTGSGCSKVAELLCSDFSKLKAGLRSSDSFTNSVFKRKFEICANYLSYNKNWQKYELIKYKDILLFYLFSYYGLEPNKIMQVLLKFYRENKKDENSTIVNKLVSEIFEITQNENVIAQIKELKGKFNDIRTKEELAHLYDLFFGDDFRRISKEIFLLLEKYGCLRRTKLLHHISNNIRNSGDPLNKDRIKNIDYIYTLASLTNRLVKAKKQRNDEEEKPTKIVLDSLRNSLEIMFFKERYSGFYMLATKDGKNRRRSRLIERLKLKNVDCTEIDSIVDGMISLDAIEYRVGDFAKGRFSSPDVYNCIQKSDIHIINNRKDDFDEDDDNNSFFTREEQLLKFISLIQQPGIITPSPSERCMQIAFIAKLNSGCVSRQVGAVVTDTNYSVKSIGWNDVPKGQTPCNLRSVNDFVAEELSDSCYSDFEKGKDVSNVDVEFKYKHKEPFCFPNAVKDYFNIDNVAINDEVLNGKNPSFCFKSVHNHFEEEKNQVHTKSLHAEENAMLQISKYGGQGLEGGILFTTASPCELCSKKASQLGVVKVYYIDPYPGISKPQIFSYYKNKMKLVSFNGVIGKSYNKLYEPFMSYKDELSIMLENKPKDYRTVDWEDLLEQIKSDELRQEFKRVIDSGKLNEEKLLKIMKE